MAGEREGVIKYRLDFQAGDAAGDEEALARLSGWRAVLRHCGLLGQDAGRYQGYGFGNVSIRSGEGFLISGTQTGGEAWLPPAGYARVISVDLADNRVRATGAVKPSSEALTHAAVYALHPDVAAVLHGHSAALFRAARAMALPRTAPDVPYGTPAMARAVSDLHREQGWREQGLFVMAGHEDGVMAFAGELDTAGGLLVQALARAPTRAGRSTV